MKVNKMAKPIYKIEDNFLEKGPFHQLQSFFLGGNTLPWGFGEFKVRKDNHLHNFQWVHTFWKEDKGIVSDYWSQLTPIIRKIDPATWIRIKANVTPYNNEILKYDLHCDTHYKCTTAVFFLNTCNGYTYFKDGTKVESVANRLLTFPSYYQHAGTTCSDDKIRCVLNLNYITKEDLKYEKEI